MTDSSSTSVPEPQPNEVAPVEESRSQDTSTATTNMAPEGDNNNSSSNFIDAEAAAAWGAVLSQLARQLEYYLSSQNLAKDTYVETLRSLNDKCVPVSILANFSKVRQILMAVGVIDEHARRHAVWQACNHYSSKLRTVSINTKTGKQIVGDDDQSQDNVTESTIMGVGTMDNEPITILEAPMPMPSLEFANTIVLRDVAPQVSQEDIHALFKFEGCPPVISIVPDVAQCWFVQLDTKERSDVMYALLQLRGESLAGEPVHARIKSSVAASSLMIDPAPLMSIGWQTEQQSKKNNGSPGSPSRRKNNKGKGRTKNGKNKSRNGNGNNTGNSSSNVKNHSNSNNSSTSNNGSTSKNNNGNKKSNKSNSSPASTPSKKKTIVPVPPSLGVEDFPTLQQDDRVEWETPPVQDDLKSTTQVFGVREKMAEEDESMVKSIKLGSDSASTATTASSSTEPGIKKVGYAAALKKTEAAKAAPPAPKPVLETPPTTPVYPKAVTETRNIEEEFEASPVIVKPPSWGGGRSFADALRKTQAAA